MVELGPESIAEVISLCQANAEEMAQAFSRTFDTPLEVSVGLGTTWEGPAKIDGFDGPGLMIGLMFDNTALAAVLPEASGLLPAWCAQPDATGRSRLATLAQELALLILPPSVSVNEHQATFVPLLATAIGEASPSPNAARVPIVLKTGKDKRGTLSLIWPLRTPRKVIAGEPVSGHGPVAAAQPAADRRSTRISSDHLPSYTRSLLRVRVPLSVTLAAKRQSVRQILELGIGSIIQFDKPCDDPLDLEINGHRIAQGEAVKVGDKFGLRVHSVLLPEERLKPLTKRR